jgi:hypothetical protein
MEDGDRLAALATERHSGEAVEGTARLLGHRLLARRPKGRAEYIEIVPAQRR